MRIPPKAMSHPSLQSWWTVKYRSRSNMDTAVWVAILKYMYKLIPSIITIAFYSSWEMNLNIRVEVRVDANIVPCYKQAWQNLQIWSLVSLHPLPSHPSTTLFITWWHFLEMLALFIMSYDLVYYFAMLRKSIMLTFIPPIPTHLLKPSRANF